MSSEGLLGSGAWLALKESTSETRGAPSTGLAQGSPSNKPLPPLPISQMGDRKVTHFLLSFPLYLDTSAWPSVPLVQPDIPSAGPRRALRCWFIQLVDGRRAGSSLLAAQGQVCVFSWKRPAVVWGLSSHPMGNGLDERALECIGGHRSHPA